MGTEKNNSRATGYILSFFGIFLMSFDSLLIRLARVSSWNVAFYRGLFIFLILGIIFIKNNKKNSFQVIKEGGIPLCISGILWGLSGLFFVLAVKMTLAANALVFLSLSPVFAAVLSFFMLREFVPLRTWVAILVSLSGVLVIVFGDIGSGNMLGNMFGLLAPLCLSFNFTHLRKHPDINRMASVLLGGIVTSSLSISLASPLSVPPQSLFYLALLGLFVMPFSQLLLSHGTKYLPSPEVGLIMMNETFLGPIWIWLVLSEIPTKNTFIGGGIILAAMAVNSVLSLRTKKVSI
jgi:drug/metabolite transporter (DMT)-like permease